MSSKPHDQKMSSTPKPPIVLEPLQKPDLLLIHGFRGAPRGLEAIASELRSAGYNVHVPPIPPFGGAPALSEYTAETYARYIADYIEQHQLLRPILIGHSMGSIIAAATCHIYPEQTHQKLILLSPISKATARPLRLIAPLSARLPSSMTDYVTTRFLFVPHDRTLFRQSLVATHECASLINNAQSDIIASARFSSHSAVSDFPLTQKILFLAGTKDRLIHKKHTRRLAKKLSAEAAFIPGSGHLHIYEKPHETAEAILRFLEQ